MLGVGLWGKSDAKHNLGLDDNVDWEDVYQLAREQTVQGLVLAGLERSDAKSSQEMLLQWIGEVQLLEQRNDAMNMFVAELIERLRKEYVHCLLVKGQGLIQCYEKPLWRASGDIDLLLNEENYRKAKGILMPIASDVSDEDETTKHQALVIEEFNVELHGAMPFLLSKRADNVIEKTLTNVLSEKGEMIVKLGNVDVPLPNPDNHIIIVFTHFLHHFFIEGVGLRQICDWCRLLYTYRDSLDCELLESRIKAMGLISEWKAFASLAVDTLGMPKEAMPFYDDGFKRKGEKVLSHILKTGNFGQNKDLSYRVKYNGFVYRMVSFWRRFVDFVQFVPIFPLDAPRFFITYVMSKVK